MLEFTKNWNASSLGVGQGMPSPLLENLVLKIQRCTTESLSVTEFSSLPTSFTPSPRLAHIELPEWPLPKTFPHLPTLKSLTIDGMFLDAVAVHEIIPLLDSTPSLWHFVLKGSEFLSSYSTTSDYYPRTVYLPDLLTVDVKILGGGAYILLAMNAPQLIDVGLDGYRGHGFDGQWEEFLTEPSERSSIVYRRAHRISSA